MTPQDISKWRQDRNLRQNVMARLLGVADRTVKRWEAGDSAAPQDLADKLAALAIEPVTAADPVQHADTPAPAPQASKWKHPRWLTLSGEPCPNPFGPGHRYPRNRCFWRLDWADEVTGVEHYNLYQAGLNGQLGCTAIRMNAETWRVKLDFMRNPANERAVEQLNALMAPRQVKEPEPTA